MSKMWNSVFSELLKKITISDNTTSSASEEIEPKEEVTMGEERFSYEKCDKKQRRSKRQRDQECSYQQQHKSGHFKRNVIVKSEEEEFPSEEGWVSFQIKALQSSPQEYEFNMEKGDDKSEEKRQSMYSELLQERKDYMKQLKQKGDQVEKLPDGKIDNSSAASVQQRKRVRKPRPPIPDNVEIIELE